MKASFLRSFGGPEVLQHGDLPDPAPAAGQYAHGIELPHVPGRDFSGVVAALGEGAKDLKVGDAVFGVCEVPREGAYAEKIAIPQQIVARKPGPRTPGHSRRGRKRPGLPAFRCRVAAAAHRVSEARHLRGKLVLQERQAAR